MSNMAAESAARSDVRHTFAAALWTVTTIIAVVILSRRMGGHFENALHPLTANFSAAILAAVNVFAALLVKSPRQSATSSAQQSRNLSVATSLLTAVPPMAVGFSLLPSGAIAGHSAIVAIALVSGLCVLVAGSEGTRTLGVSAEHNQLSESNETVVEDEPEATEFSASDVYEDSVQSDLFQDDSHAVSQSMSRSTNAEGAETIEGTVLLSFATGQQIGVAHLPFSPQLATQPKVSCHLLEDRPVRIRVTTAQTFGVRLEAKRTASTLDEEDILVGYIITAENTCADAA